MTMVIKIEDDANRRKHWVPGMNGTYCALKQNGGIKIQVYRPSVRHNFVESFSNLYKYLDESTLEWDRLVLPTSQVSMLFADSATNQTVASVYSQKVFIVAREMFQNSHNFWSHPRKRMCVNWDAQSALRMPAA